MFILLFTQNPGDAPCGPERLGHANHCQCRDDLHTLGVRLLGSNQKETVMRLKQIYYAVWSC